MTEQAIKHLYLVDGSGYIFRAFFAIPPMTRPDKTPVNAVFGFSKMISKLVADSGADAVAVIFDTSRRTFRSEIYADYKAQRPEPPEKNGPRSVIPIFSGRSNGNSRSINARFLAN